MLKRPSSRRKQHQGQIELNLVPILDTMVTLIGFMLFTMAFTSIVSIESPVPIVSPEIVEEKIKEKPLQLTLTIHEQETRLWSPFGRIEAKVIPSIQPGEPDIRAIHEALLEIKQQFPKELKIVFVPYAGASYDTLISAMDSVREIEASDPPLYLKNEETGNDELVKALFPQVVFGNILGDTAEGGI